MHVNRLRYGLRFWASYLNNPTSKGWGRRLAKPQRQSGALTAVQPRRRGRGFETAEQAAERAKFDLALVAALSDAGLRRSEAASLTWGLE